MAVWLARGVTDRLVAVSLGLIMGGALSNAIDRLVLGGVADFFSLHAFGFYWYVFNIADAAIVAGVAGSCMTRLSPESQSCLKVAVSHWRHTDLGDQIEMPLRQHLRLISTAAVVASGLALSGCGGSMVSSSTASCST